jgi:hypothetical protein
MVLGSFAKSLTSMVALLMCAVSCAAQTGDLLFRPVGGGVVVGGRVAHLGSGDLNGDSHADVVAALGDHDAVAVLLGDGRGGFRPAAGSPFPAGDGPHLLALGDFNGDRRTDVAATSHDSNDIIVLIGTGAGVLRPAPGSPFTALEGVPPHNHGLVAADFNGDRILDLATSNQDGNSVSVVLGDGRARFRPAPGSPFAVGRAPYPLAVADVNGDGRVDLATPDVGSASVTVLLNQSRGGFARAPGSPHRVAARPYFAHFGDVDGDRRMDLVITHDDINRVTILLGDGRGGFRAGPAAETRARGWKAAQADVNRDGRIDLLIGGQGGVHVLLGQGGGRFRNAPGSPFGGGGDAWSAVAADLNGDGIVDLVVPGRTADQVVILLGRRSPR